MASMLKEKALRASKTINVGSSAFTDGKAIPREHSGLGEDVSPPLKWSGVPAGASAIAIIVDDPDAPGGTYTHWLAWDLPASTQSLDRGANIKKLGGVEGKNDFGFSKYMGPKPPSGTHHYHFQVFALSDKLNLPKDANAQRVWEALNGKVLAWGEVVGTFTKP
jgi:hypothetical protein